MNEMGLVESEPVELRPQLRELGWDVVKGVYTHESGATVERRAQLDDERGELVYEARINGGEWHEVREKFWETTERALAGVGFATGTIPGTVAPTDGTHAGVPMVPGSALAQALANRPESAPPPYGEFLSRKTQAEGDGGFEPLWLPEFLFDFQTALVEWSVRKGRAAIFADCGLGKSVCELVWAENVVRKTNGAVLLLTPLAVTSQMLREAEKFGIEARRADPKSIGPGIHVTNYERLHHLDPSQFTGVVCDEAGILKNFDGATRWAVTEFMRKVPYRLLATATAAPNDFYELGNASEALGHLGFIDMLSRFFKNNRNNTALNSMGHRGGAPVWRFRGHAEQPFWRWVCSWARAMRKPSDLGFDDGPFQLPKLVRHEHVVKARKPREGMLFSVPAYGLAEEREERRRTLTERCEMAAALVADTGQPAVCWAHLNDEGDRLQKIIPGALQVSGKDSDESKEEKFAAFESGQARVLVIKPKIGAWGLNWQHCAHTVTFAGHSFEADYQSTRRFWRFGQTRDVVVDYILSDGEQRVIANLQRKSEQADRMFSELTRHMRDELALSRVVLNFDKQVEVPPWL